MFSLFRRKSSESRPAELDHQVNVDDPDSDRRNFDGSLRTPGNYRYSHYSSINSGEGSPPRIVVYARPPENLTSPYRESSPDPQQELVQDSNLPSLPSEHCYHNNHVQRKYSKQARSAEDSSKVIVVRRSKSATGPLSFLRKSFRRNSDKRQLVASYKVAPTTSPVANGTSSPQRNGSGSRDHVSRKFSDPYYASVTSAVSGTSGTGSKLVPGRATSPKSLITLKPAAAAASKAKDPEDMMMYSMVVPETYINPMFCHTNDNGDVVTQRSSRNDADVLSKRRSIAVAPSYHPSGHGIPNYALPQISEQVSNGFPSAAAAAMGLPRPPSNLGVPYYPPPPQAVSATANPQVNVRKSSKTESSGHKIFSGPSIRPLRISLRSKVRSPTILQCNLEVIWAMIWHLKRNCVL